MIVVTGATGNVGLPLVQHLAARGERVRAVTRTVDVEAAAKLPAGTQTITADIRDPDTLERVLDGASAVFVNPRAVGDGVDALVAVAQAKGVRRLVALSAMNVEEDPAHQPSRFNGDRNTEVESAVTHSGLEWVALRPSFYATNTIGLYGRQLQMGDVVRGPFPDFAEAPQDPEDIARVAAKALTDFELVGQRIELTGPQSLTQSEMVERIGQVTGRAIRFEEVPAETAAKAMSAAGFETAFVDAYLRRLARLAGQPAHVTSDLQSILDRPPVTFAEWVAHHAPAFSRAA